MNERRSFLYKRMRETKAIERKNQSLNNPIELEDDTIAVADFFTKFYKINPEVLSCLVQFIMIRHLKLATSLDIENLKFGDFIYHENDECFVASKPGFKMFVTIMAY